MQSPLSNLPCSEVYCVTAIGCCVRCTHMSSVEHNSCLSTHSNNKLSLRHKQEGSLSQLTLQGKCRSVEYHYWNCNKFGTPGLIKLFLYRCYVIISDHKFLCQCVLPLSWEVAFQQWKGTVHCWVASLGLFPICLPNYSFLQPSVCLPCVCCLDLSLLSCLLSNRITALLEMTYIWLVLQHLIFSSKS